jgi:hypothetical protein
MAEKKKKRLLRTQFRNKFHLTVERYLCFFFSAVELDIVARLPYWNEAKANVKM